MRGISEQKIEQIVKALEKANFAINTLERANQNKELFADTKTELQLLQTELTDRYLVRKAKSLEDE